MTRIVSITFNIDANEDRVAAAAHRAIIGRAEKAALDVAEETGTAVTMLPGTAVIPDPRTDDEVWKAYADKRLAERDAANA